MEVRLRFRIYGRVQGVFFRAEAKRQAEVLGLLGWVRNLEGGAVEAVAEGDKDALIQFLRWCRKGSPFAQVSRVEAKWEPYQGEFREFPITQ